MGMLKVLTERLGGMGMFFMGDCNFDDGADAIPAFDTAPLAQFVGDEDLGKGVFTLVKHQFTSNASGEIAILIYGVTDVDAYVDNVKVYPL